MERTLRIGALNIVAQPHSAPIYQNLLLKVRNRRKAGRVRGDRFGAISLMTKHPNPKSKGAYVQGLIGTFTRIKVDSDWINLATGTKAEGAELAGLNIPEGLHPNLVFHRFRFYLKEHVLTFEIGNSGARLTPKNAQKLFERLFSAESVITAFGDISVTVWPEKNAVTKIISDKHLREVRLLITAPNPDNGKQAERAFMTRLQRLNAKHLKQTVTAKSSRALELDKELKDAIRIAATNGSAEATTIRNGKAIILSTVDKPLVFTHTYSTEVTPEDAAFGIASDLVLHEMKQKK